MHRLLSPQEEEALKLRNAGRSNKEIAEIFSVGVERIGKIFKSIKDKGHPSAKYRESDINLMIDIIERFGYKVTKK